MKLTYRGVTQEYDIPAIDLVEGEVGGKYRGQNWNYRYPRHIPVPQQAYDLKYRGVSYRIGDSAKVEAIAETVLESATARKSKPESLTNCTPIHPVPENLAKVHRANICSLLERRFQVAKAKGDETLLRLLEHEAAQLAC